MNKMKQSFLLLLVSCLMPFSVFANVLNPVVIENLTDSDATASSVAFNNACSKDVGGIIKPHGSIKIKASLINTSCVSKVCDAQIHMSGNCSGSIIGTAEISSNGGIINLSSMNESSFRLRKIDEFHAVIEGGETKNLFRLLFG